MCECEGNTNMCEECEKVYDTIPLMENVDRSTLPGGVNENVASDTDDDEEEDGVIIEFSYVSLGMMIGMLSIFWLIFGMMIGAVLLLLVEGGGL
jgi:hypothetical protein